jgi:ABC-type nitrate/sulfonate/bicarbonate transport system ATPase subunit
MRTQLEAPAVEPLTGEGTSIAVRGASRRFGDLLALDGLDITARRGEVLGVVGPSGCGKSTLLELIGGLAEPDGGTVCVDGNDSARERRALCAHMPQSDLLLPWRDALGNAALALECQGTGAREARRRAGPLFERFGLASFEDARPAELSGGMRQRVAFLRTLLAGRPVLLLDEPFAALDAITRSEMQAWLSSALEAEPRTVVLVTHDVEEALFLSDRVVVMGPRPGRVIEEVDVPLPRPRDRHAAITDSRLARLRARVLEALR